MKRRVIALATLMALGWALGARRAEPANSAATGVLSGEVRSGGESLDFANVIVFGTRLGTQTDSAGRFLLAAVPTGPIRLGILAVGYRKLDTLLIVRAGENPPVRVELLDRFPPPACQPCFWVPPFQGRRAIRPGAMVLDFVGEEWSALIIGDVGELAIRSDPDPCQLGIRYSFPRSASRTRLCILDSLGRTVRTLGQLKEHRGQLFWDGLDDWGRRTSHGLYHVRLETSEDTLQLEFGRVRRPPIR